MSPLSRRHVVKAGACVSACAAFSQLFTKRAWSRDGALVRDPHGILDLAPGFRYHIIDRTGELMDDGHLVPADPDGMAAFAGEGGKIILLRNHELDPFADASHYWPEKAHPYDRTAAGGVSRLVIDPHTLDVKARNMVLTGTLRNCAGGVSPWGWLSCEETLAARHGYVFLCDPAAERAAPWRRIEAYGRFNHEAAVVRPGDHTCYLTEDRVDGCFYRFKPHSPDAPFEGRLQAMAVKKSRAFDTGTIAQGDDALAVTWIDTPEVAVDRDDLRFACLEKGAALVRRGEGLWLGKDGEVYFTATVGGRHELGQIFRLDDDKDHGRLRVLAESTGGDDLDMPDSVTVAPSGELFVAEDGEGDQYVRRFGVNGQLSAFARNALSHSEFSGLCFDPSGKILFLNLQHDGLTLAVTGPF